MRGRLALFVLGWLLVLGGGFIAHRVETAGRVAIADVRYRGGAAETLAARLYRPFSATPAHPAPAVMLAHGYINTRDMQTPFAIELARRGFVVLSIDMAGHGDSGGHVFGDDMGGPAGLGYLRSLPFVDRSQVGMEGHSMGGVPVVSAAAADPAGYRSMVLEGSTTAEPGQVGDGDGQFPHNLQVVFGRWDEFAPLMWGEAKGADVGRSPKMQALFGVQGPIAPGRLYGDISNGSARRLLIPPVDHPMEHFSAAGVGAAVDWFQRTLHGEASPRAAGDQIWLWRDVGTGLGLIGFVCVVLGAFEALLATPFFASVAIREGEAQSSVARALDGRWLAGVLLCAAIPAASYFPLMDLGAFFTPSQLYPEAVANQIVVWGVVNAAVGIVVGVILGRRRTTRRTAVAKSVILGACCVALGYLALMASRTLFGTDFRFWVVALRPLDARHAPMVLAYLPPFLLSFWVMMRNLAAGVLPPLHGSARQYGAAIAGLTGGFAVLLALQYAVLLIGGSLPDPRQALNTIIAIQFAPLLAFAALVGTFVWRRTGGYAVSATICALIFSWYIVAGTATHWHPGYAPAKPVGLYPSHPAASASRGAP
ncbi:MAG TPA: alpha/beta fold hydrolase [Caulobacteraceae bacterium]|jgi:pimeloyl-ACP methyl ester carboxylesterase|nr:alpha/beta fold hydrolase [Caulobacteraceae bacterium]